MLSKTIECNFKSIRMCLIGGLSAFVLSAPIDAQTAASPISERGKGPSSSVPLVLEYDGLGRPYKKVPLQFPIEFDGGLFGWFLERWAEKGYDMKYLLMKIPLPGTQLAYDRLTYPTYYRFRKELQRFGLQLPNPNQAHARHFHLPEGENPSDPGGLLREGTVKSSRNYNTPEEEKKRLKTAARIKNRPIIKQAALEEIRRLESSAATQSSREAPGQ